MALSAAELARRQALRAVLSPLPELVAVAGAFDHCHVRGCGAPRATMREGPGGRTYQSSGCLAHAVRDGGEVPA